jgi:hypothetical protein
MKKLLLILAFVLVGCSNDPVRLDGHYVKDAEGNIYRVHAKMADTYFLRPYVVPTPDNGLEKLLAEEN